MARDSADRRAHSTSVDRARHASIHFYCARRQAASSRSGLMPDGAGAEFDRAAGPPLVSPDDGPTFPVASGSSADPGMEASISGAATVPRSMPEKTVPGRPTSGASGAARAGSPAVAAPGTGFGMGSGGTAGSPGAVVVLSSKTMTTVLTVWRSPSTINVAAMGPSHARELPMALAGALGVILLPAGSSSLPGTVPLGPCAARRAAAMRSDLPP